MTYVALSGNTAIGGAGTSITHYSLEYYQSSGNTWVVVNTNTSQLLTSITYSLSSGIFPSGST